MQYVEIALTPKTISIMYKDEIANWFLQGADPEEGRRLLEANASNPRQARLVRGMSAGMVAYELKLLLGIPKAEIFAKKKSDVQLVQEFYLKTKPAPASVETRHGTSLQPTAPMETRYGTTPQPAAAPKPKPVAVNTIILQAKETIADLSKKISRIHNHDLYDMGEANTPKVKEIRAKLVEYVRAMNAMKDSIHNLKEEYFETGEVSADLRPLLREAEELLNPKPAHKSGKKEDLSKVDGAELFRRKENLRRNIAKYCNLLKYQTKTKQAKEDPMPEGPDRVKTERKLEELRNELTAIQNEMARRKKEPSKTNKK